MNSQRTAAAIVAHGLGVRATTDNRDMQELREIQVSRLKAAVADLRAGQLALSVELESQRIISRDKDRGRRRTISTLYMALVFLAGFAVYVLVRK